QEEWKKHFIHTGELGSAEFASVMNHTTSAMKSVFEQVNAPYSGMDPKALEDAINAVDLDNKNAPLKSVIDDAA
ncbi:hypothetical protein HWN77_27440, partial [Escherichia coli]